MKKMLQIALAVVFMMTLAGTMPFAAIAGECGGEDTEVYIGGEMRWRAEVDGRDFNSDTDLSSFNLLRARINTALVRGNAKAFVQLQYSNMSGWDSGNLGQDIGVDVHQAYMKLHHFILDPLTVKLGRFEMKYGDERVIGAVGWSNVGRTFEGAQFKYKTDDYWFDFFYTTQQERYNAANHNNSPDDYFAGIWGGLINPVPIEFFILKNMMAGTNDIGDMSSDMNIMTLGLHYSNKYDMGLKTTVDFAYQMGKDKALMIGEEEKDIAAMMYRVYLGYMIDHDLKPMVGFGIDMTTGDDDPNDDKLKTYHNLYYTGHKFRGAMDYFVADNDAVIGGKGLRDIFFNVKLMPMENMKMMLEYHNFATAEDYQYVNSSGNIEDVSAVGSEIDFHCYYKYKGTTSIGAGLGYFMASDEWKGADADNSLWGYLQFKTYFDMH